MGPQAPSRIGKRPAVLAKEVRGLGMGEPWVGVPVVERRVCLGGVGVVLRRLVGLEPNVELAVIVA